MKAQFQAFRAAVSQDQPQHETFPVTDGALLLRVMNREPAPLLVEETMDKSLVQFYFNLKGSVTFHFGPRYQLPLAEGKSFLLYNPLQELPLRLELSEGAQLVGLLITVSELHKLLTDEDELTFLQGERINQKFYKESLIGPGQRIVLEQIFSAQMNHAPRNLYFRGKAFELLSFYFQREESRGEAACPFLDDEQNVVRIRRAKQILLEHITDPPALKDLAREVGLNEYRLKAGFKNIYGKSPYHYLTDHRMEQARKLMQEERLKVNEVAFAVGYSNPSHFIAAFKKRFNITPKKFLSSLQVK